MGWERGSYERTSGNREGTAGRNITGSIQPFGYTGYQADRIAGTYYAQAREYRAEMGRFAGRDIIKGFAAAPYTLNEYGYCFGNPEKYVDNDGQWPTIVIGALVGAAIGGVGSIVSDVVSGNDIDWGKAGRNTLKGAATGALVGTGIGAVGAVAVAVPGTTAATVAAAQTTYCVTTAIGIGVGGVSNCVTHREGDVFSNFMNGATGSVVGREVARLTKSGFLAGASGSVIVNSLNDWDDNNQINVHNYVKDAIISGVMSELFGVLGMNVLEGSLNQYGSLADGVISFFHTIYSFLQEGITYVCQEIGE